MKKIKYAKKNKKKLLVNNELLQLIMNAPIDPEYVKGLSPILGRDLLKESLKEDNEDYNFSLVSRRINIGVRLLMEAGLKKTAPLDLIRLFNDHMRFLAVENDQKYLDKAIENQNYIDFMYDHRIENDIRSYFLLQTSSSDTFEGLMDELENHIQKVMTKNEWEYLKKAIYEGEKRIRKEKLNFAWPVEGYEKGEKKFPTKEEQEALGFEYEPEFYYDYRNDDHDLLSLKELVEIVKGKDVHPLSIGPGFFLKYMPEITQTTSSKNFLDNWYNNPDACINEVFLDENKNLKTRVHDNKKENDPRIAKGFEEKDFDKFIPDSIIFKVDRQTKKLKKIELAQVPVYRKFVSSGIMIASLSLHFKQTLPLLKRIYGVKNVNLHADEVVNYKDLPEVQKTDFMKGQIEYLKSLPMKLALLEHLNLSDNDIDPKKVVSLDYLNDYDYFVCVPSQVAGPKVQEAGYRYAKVSHNTEVIKAGECYLFEKPVNEIITTRLYFMPYSPSEVHPMMQHGSVIFGHNDMSYHPCHQMGEFTNSFNELCGKTRNELIENWNNQTNQATELYKEPVFAMALLLEYYKKTGNIPHNWSDLLKKEHNDIILNIMEGKLAFSQFLLIDHDINSVFLNMSQRTPFYLMFTGIYPLFTKKLLANFYPFNERFAVWEYAKNFKGITLNQQNTMFNQITANANSSRIYRLFQFINGMTPEKMMEEFQKELAKNSLSPDEKN